jgi:signal transduction histidine kinase
MKTHNSDEWQHYRQVLEYLSSLSYRCGELKEYLSDIARGVSNLLDLDWTVVTLCQNEFEEVIASSIDIGEGKHVYSLHGLLTGTVIKMRRSLAVEDCEVNPEYGKAPEGYRSYLGVPLRTGQDEVIGTICSFNRTPRQFMPYEVNTVELFAERAATALDNYHLYQRQRRFNEVLESEVIARTEELRTAQAQLVERERLAAIGEFTAMIMHEIRNPFTTMKMGLHSFKRLALDEAMQERLTLALDEADRLERLLREILLYAKPQALQLEELEVNAFIKEVLLFVYEMPEVQQRHVELVSTKTAINILADKDKLKQVLINIVRNAAEAIEDGETIQLTIQFEPGTQEAIIALHNGGTPIPPEVLPRLTEPFYSTKSSGTGLGLAIVKRIVEAHEGRLVIQSSKADGTTVSLHLPSSSPS